MNVVQSLMDTAVEDSRLLVKNQQMGDRSEVARDLEFVLYAKDEEKARLVASFVQPLENFNMYRYSPPKSNIWGHSLRKMEPTREKALFDEFLKKAVAEYSMSGGSLQLFIGAAPAFFPPEAQGTWGHVTRQDVERFEQLFGAAAREGFFALTAQQCEMALAELIRNSALIPGSMLTQGVNISKWLIEGQPVETQSRIHLYYGMKPCISTFLQFETTAHFEFIKRVLSDLDFCKLNEKHLKPIKRGLKKKSD